MRIPTVTAGGADGAMRIPTVTGRGGVRSNAHSYRNYSSHLTEWRRARREGSLQGLTPSKRGRKPAERNLLSAKVHELEAKVARLQKELHTAHTILDVQGKVAGLLGFSLEHGKDC